MVLRKLIDSKLLSETVEFLEKYIVLNSLTLNIVVASTALIDVELTKQQEPKGIYARIQYIANQNQPHKFTSVYFKIPDTFGSSTIVL